MQILGGHASGSVHEVHGRVGLVVAGAAPNDSPARVEPLEIAHREHPGGPANAQSAALVVEVVLLVVADAIGLPDEGKSPFDVVGEDAREGVAGRVQELGQAAITAEHLDL